MKLKNSSSQSIVTKKNIKYHVMKQSLSLKFRISILELLENQYKSENDQIVSTKTIASGSLSHGNQFIQIIATIIIIFSEKFHCPRDISTLHQQFIY